MSVRAFAALVGAAALIIGLVFGLTTVKTVDSAGNKVACGSALAPDNAEATHIDGVQRIGSTLAGGSRIFDRNSSVAGKCNDAIGSRPAFAWTVIGLGAVVLLGSLVIRAPSATRA